MLKNLLLNSLKANVLDISNNPVCVQSVRWRRKPRWIPMAKSRMFKVLPRHVMPEHEPEEWLRLNNNYKTQLRSVRAYFEEEVERKKALVEQSLTPADEEAEYQRCNDLNQEWNLEISKIRDARIAKDNAERREFIQGRLEAKKIRDKELLEVIEAKVRKEKEASSTFITRSNIDQAIEHSLANPVDYNFSIDLHGNMYKGKERPGKAEK